MTARYAFIHFPQFCHQQTKAAQKTSAIELDSPNRELLRLGLAALHFSPQVAIDDGFGLIINISGCAHLFGGEKTMLKAIENSFSKLSFSIQKAIAPNPLLAKALAYFANGTIVNNSCKTYIEHLPIEALFIDSAITDELD